MTESVPKPGAYLIFGLPGTGKSTIYQKLRHRGLVAIDADHDTQLSGWAEFFTHRRLDYRPAYPLSNTFLFRHYWTWDSKRLQKLLLPSKRQAVFICGDAFSRENFFPLFRLRFALEISDAEMLKRLKQRDPNRWNDDHPELELILEQNRHNYGRLIPILEDQVIRIDGSLPPDEVVDKIMEADA